MNSPLTLPPVFTVRLDKLVGRKTELAKINRLRKSLPDRLATQFCYLYGAGGTGKTYILDHLIHTKDKSPNELIAATKIDFYDSNVHSDIELAAQLVSSIRPRDEELVNHHFAEFDRSLARYRTQESNAAQNLRDQVMSNFFEAWRSLTQTHTCMVFMDTGERLGYQVTQTDTQHVSDLPQARTLKWLQEIIQDDQKMPRTLIMLAARPQPENVHKQLLALATPSRCIAMDGLDETGVDEYFTELENALRTQKDNLDLSDEDKDRFENTAAAVALLRETGWHKKIAAICDSRPVAMALATQIYIDSGPQRQQIESLFGTSHNLTTSRQILRQALVAGLSNFTFDQASLPMQLLAILRKGLTKERLSKLLKLEEQECDEIFIYLQKQSFVKTLANNSLVLHDEIADWIDAEKYEPQKEDTSKIFGDLNDIYKIEIAECEEAISRLSELVYGGDVQSASIEAPDQESFSESPREVSAKQSQRDLDLLEQRRLRRQLSVERMYYALRFNPIEGLKQYQELQDEVFNSNSVEYAAQVLTEFSRWWWEPSLLQPNTFRYRAIAEQGGIDQTFINLDLQHRQIQRLFNSDLHKTIQVCNEALKKNDTRAHEYMGDWLSLYLLTAEGVLVETKQKADEIKALFTEIIGRLQNKLNTLKEVDKGSAESLHQYLIKSALAFGYYEMGFFESNLARHGNAVQFYPKSRRLYEELSNDINLARTINDHGYSLAQIGRSSPAHSNVEDGLKFRQKLGFGRSIAYSLNTLASLQTMAQRPLSAIYHARKALAIFQRLEDRFGQVLALRTLTEAWRRNETIIQDQLLRRKRCLENAFECINQALKLATVNGKPIAGPDFMAELYDEYACVLRSQAILAKAAPEQYPKDYHTFGKAAEDQFQEALAHLKDDELFIRRRVDILINLLGLYHILGFDEKADTQIQKIEDIPLVKALCDSETGEYTEYTRTGTVFWYYLVKLFVFKLRRVPNDIKDERNRKTLVENSLQALHFINLVGGERRMLQDSRHHIYERLKKLRPHEKEEIASLSLKLAPNLKMPEKYITVLRDYMHDNFGTEIEA